MLYQGDCLSPIQKCLKCPKMDKSSNNPKYPRNMTEFQCVNELILLISFQNSTYIRRKVLLLRTSYIICERVPRQFIIRM